MNTIVVSGLVLLVLLLLVVFWTRSKRGKALPYDLQEALFSPAERSTSSSGLRPIASAYFL